MPVGLLFGFLLAVFLCHSLIILLTVLCYAALPIGCFILAICSKDSPAGCIFFCILGVVLACFMFPSMMTAVQNHNWNG